VHPELATHKGELAFAEVQVVTRSGTRFARRVDYPKGSGRRPLTQTELEQKFFDCARVYAPSHDWSSALQAILDLRTSGSVATVVKALTVAG
jgi:2-methylcitrate dehydratase PrpD